MIYSYPHISPLSSVKFSDDAGKLLISNVVQICSTGSTDGCMRHCALDM